MGFSQFLSNFAEISQMEWCDSNENFGNESKASEISFRKPFGFENKRIQYDRNRPVAWRNL